METYIVLGNYTQQGVSQIKDGPSRLEAARRTLESVGGRLVAWYLTIGQYDYIAIVEVPDAKAAASALLKVGGQGSASTTSMRALTESEFAGVVAALS